jgi:hypothetical protein
MTRLFQIAAIVTMLFLGPNFGATATSAADLPVVPGHSHTQERASPAPKADREMRLEEFAQGPNATCTAWTDGCRTCARNPDGVFCSNVGIACLASAPRCTQP